MVRKYKDKESSMDDIQLNSKRKIYRKPQGKSFLWLTIIFQQLLTGQENWMFVVIIESFYIVNTIQNF